MAKTLADLEMKTYMVQTDQDVEYFDLLKDAQARAQTLVQEDDYPEGEAVTIFKAVAIVEPQITREAVVTKLDKGKDV